MKFSVKVFSTLAVVYSLIFTSPASAQTEYRGVTVGRFLSQSNIEELSNRWGVNLVIYPIIIPNVEALDEDEYFAELEDALSLLDQLLPIFEENSIQVWLKMYSPPGGFGPVQGRLSQHLVFSEDWARAAYKRAWLEIASHYSGESTIGGFHLLNEPAPGKNPDVKWTALAQEVIDTIRAVDPERTIGVSSVYGNPIKINDLKRLVRIPNLVFIAHLYYLPYCQQGLYGRPLLNYSSKVFKKFKKIVEPLKKFQNKYRVPVMNGETGVVNWANGAEQFMNDALGLYEMYGFKYWAIHALFEAPEWDPTGTAHGEVMKAYFGLND